MALLSKMADPQMVAQAQKDPEFYKVGASSVCQVGPTQRRGLMCS